MTTAVEIKHSAFDFVLIRSGSVSWYQEHFIEVLRLNFTTAMCLV